MARSTVSENSGGPLPSQLSKFLPIDPPLTDILFRPEKSATHWWLFWGYECPWAAVTIFSLMRRVDRYAFNMNQTALHSLYLGEHVEILLSRAGAGGLTSEPVRREIERLSERPSQR
ncbi:hypothetical protein EVAR_4644_1 [Eumeta japonica]|uniref:Uncharacterized protein n=1 Tax=Eumeta variegata TaxID=151549 RepID=A0A4C1SZU1_EUMVA|nr:hypothetical protein EVAR_4644_1 [Eumeta japonica]